MVDQNDTDKDDPFIQPPKNAFPTTLADLRLHSLSSDNPEDFASKETIYKTLGRLRKSTLSIPNRLRSVLTDAHFIESLFHHLNRLCPLDHNSADLVETFRYTCDNSGNDFFENGKAKRLWSLIPNERSGSWPLNPTLKLRSQQEYLSSTSTPNAALTTASETPASSPTCYLQSQTVSAYLKSTDGHINQWSFSLRRLNLPVLSILGYNYGAVLIDTTRRGKTYPDALRRTAPIYTCVWNHVLFPTLASTGICDFQPCNLDASETAQIKSRIPGFVADLEDLGLDLDKIRAETKRPTRCVWVAAPASGDDQLNRALYSLAVAINQERRRWKDTEGVDGVNILVCCSASRRVAGAEMSEEGYIQGSGDDSEGWSYGLTAKIFWANRDKMMAAVENGEDIEELVKWLVRQSEPAGSGSSVVAITPTTNLFLGTYSSNDSRQTPSNFDLIITCDRLPGEENPDKKLMSLGCKSGKLGSKMLRERLTEVKEKAMALFQQNRSAKILVMCSTGSVELHRIQHIDKQFIKQRLAWISTVKADTNPSRATLQAVNSFLMERPA